MVRVDEDIALEVLATLEKELKRQERGPFQRGLQRLLGFRPTAEALQSFANKHPDRWAQAVTILAGLAGYEKGINVTLTVKPVDQMNDQELLEEYRKAQVMIAARARGADGGVGLPALPSPITEVGPRDR